MNLGRPVTLSHKRCVPYRRWGEEIDNIYGDGNGGIWMDDVGCSGSENSLADCYHRGWGVHNCDHDEDVAIECLPPTVPPADGSHADTLSCINY